MRIVNVRRTPVLPVPEVDALPRASVFAVEWKHP
jgi:hypothetical protein